MEFSLFPLVAFWALLFTVAFLYSSVGHGGASGYLAIMALFSFPSAVMSSTALLLNILVSGIALIAFTRAGYFSWRLTVPFLVTSIPMAFLGGTLRISSALFGILLAGVLVSAALRLILGGISRPFREPHVVFPSLAVALPAGGGIGLLSGVVGIGGGVFLSPLLLISGWADPKQTAAASACFILLNSLAGIAGRFFQETVVDIPSLSLVAVAGAGGLLGSWAGARRFTGSAIRKLLGVVLLVAAAKLILGVL